MASPGRVVLRGLKTLGYGPNATLWVTFRRGAGAETRVSSSSGLVRWGSRPGGEFPPPVEGAGRVETLFRPCFGGVRLVLREGMGGELRVGDKRLSLGELAAWGLVRGKGMLRGVDLTPQMTGRIEFRGFEVSFEFGAPAPKEAAAAAPVERRFRQGLLPRRPFTSIPATPVPARFRRDVLQPQDRPFAVVAWSIYAVLTVFVAVLVTRPYPKEVETAETVQQFAKILYEAPQAESKVRREIMKRLEAERRVAAAARPEQPVLADAMAGAKPPAGDRESQARMPSKAAEAPQPSSGTETVAQGEGGGGGSGGGTGGGGGGGGPGDGSGGPGGGGGIGGGGGAGGPGGGPGWAGPMSRADVIRQKVANTGMLAALAGRGGASRARVGGAVFRGTGPGGGADLDQVLDKVGGLRMAPGTPGAGGGGGSGGGWGGPGWGPGGGGGGGGGGVARGIDDAARQVASASVKAPQLQERKDKVVESKEAEAAPDALSLAEARAAINKAVASYVGGLRYLYNNALRKNPDLEGKLTVDITVAPNGTVSDCRMVSSTLNAPDLEKAILERIRKWILPVVSSKPITVTYPFVFFPNM